NGQHALNYTARTEVVLRSPESLSVRTRLCQLGIPCGTRVTSASREDYEAVRMAPWRVYQMERFVLHEPRMGLPDCGLKAAGQASKWSAVCQSRNPAPPLTLHTCPETHVVSSDRRKQMVCARSLGSPRRVRVRPARIWSLNSSLIVFRAVSLMTAPGLT